MSYVLLFVIVASCLRRSEVPAFMKYNLVLAVICALGTIWEYRFHYNVFYDMVGQAPAGHVHRRQLLVGGMDDIGRRMTMGPAEHPLEVTGDADDGAADRARRHHAGAERRSRDPLRLAACILLAAAISTYRKSALLAPIAAC